MATSYPGALDAFNNPTGTDALNNATTPHATQHTDANDAIEAIQAELGINPKGSSATVVARLGTLAPIASPTFTGTVVLPSTTSIGNVSATEIGYVDGVTSAIQTQLDAKAGTAGPTFTGTVTMANASATNIQLSVGTLATTGTVNLDFATEGYKTQAALTGDITYTATNYAAGKSCTVRVINGTTQRTLTFPTNWVFVGTKPSNIAASKTGVLTVTSFGTTEANCVAAWAVQA